MENVVVVRNIGLEVIKVQSNSPDQILSSWTYSNSIQSPNPLTNLPILYTLVPTHQPLYLTICP